MRERQLQIDCEGFQFFGQGRHVEFAGQMRTNAVSPSNELDGVPAEAVSGWFFRSNQFA